MANRTKPLILRVPVNEQERELIEQKMKLIPTKTFAAYARKMLIDGYIIQIDHSDIKAMTAEIQKIGVNAEPLAEQGKRNGLWANVLVPVVKQNTVAAIVVTALPAYKGVHPAALGRHKPPYSGHTSSAAARSVKEICSPAFTFASSSSTVGVLFNELNV